MRVRYSTHGREENCERMSVRYSTHGREENCAKVVVRKHERKRELGKHGRKWEDTIKVGVQEKG
jgi:hypothetical protein